MLTKLRKTIRATAPKATEGLGYGMAMFRHPNGRPLVYFAYWKDHCALYGAGLGFIEAHAAELKPYRLSKGTIRFTTDEPLPDRLVRMIVKARLAEVEKAGWPFCARCTRSAPYFGNADPLRPANLCRTIPG